MPRPETLRRLQERLFVTDPLAALAIMYTLRHGLYKEKPHHVDETTWEQALSQAFQYYFSPTTLTELDEDKWDSFNAISRLVGRQLKKRFELHADRPFPKVKKVTSPVGKVIIQALRKGARSAKEVQAQTNLPSHAIGRYRKMMDDYIKKPEHGELEGVKLKEIAHLLATTEDAHLTQIIIDKLTTQSLFYLRENFPKLFFSVPFKTHEQHVTFRDIFIKKNIPFRRFHKLLLIPSTYQSRAEMAMGTLGAIVRTPRKNSSLRSVEQQVASFEKRLFVKEAGMKDFLLAVIRDKLYVVTPPFMSEASWHTHLYLTCQYFFGGINQETLAQTMIWENGETYTRSRIQQIVGHTLETLYARYKGSSKSRIPLPFSKRALTGFTQRVGYFIRTHSDLTDEELARNASEQFGTELSILYRSLRTLEKYGLKPPKIYDSARERQEKIRPFRESKNRKEIAVLFDSINSTIPTYEQRLPFEERSILSVTSVVERSSLANFISKKQVCLVADYLEHHGIPVKRLSVISKKKQYVFTSYFVAASLTPEMLDLLNNNQLFFSFLEETQNNSR